MTEWEDSIRKRLKGEKRELTEEQELMWDRLKNGIRPSSVVGYRGKTTLDAGMFYAPYVPIIKNNAIIVSTDVC